MACNIKVTVLTRLAGSVLGDNAQILYRTKTRLAKGGYLKKDEEFNTDWFSCSDANVCRTNLENSPCGELADYIRKEVGPR